MLGNSAMSYVLSSVASVGRIIETALGLSRAATPAEFRKIETAERAKVAQQVGAFRDAHIASQMTQQTVETLRKEMERIARETGQAARDQTLSRAGRTRLLKDLQKEYCWHLREIKRFSGDALPTDLENEWKNNSCDGYYLP
jgi:hypothetical protein